MSAHRNRFLGSGFARNAGQHHARQAKIRVIEEIEKLSIESQFHVLGHREPLGQVQVAPEEVGAAQSVAAEISELAVLMVVAPKAGSSCRIRGVFDEQTRRKPLVFAADAVRYGI
jgi:hypothetical protein